MHFFILISTLERLLQFSYGNLASMYLGPKPVNQDTDERTPQKNERLLRCGVFIRCRVNAVLIEHGYLIF